MKMILITIDPVQRLEQAGNQLNTALEFYTIWGRDLGLALFACCMAATLLGFFIKSM